MYSVSLWQITCKYVFLLESVIKNFKIGRLTRWFSLTKYFPVCTDEEISLTQVSLSMHRQWLVDSGAANQSWGQVANAREKFKWSPQASLGLGFLILPLCARCHIKLWKGIGSWMFFITGIKYPPCLLFVLWSTFVYWSHFKKKSELK